MSTLFLKIVNLSISASWLVLAVLLLRPLFKKAPKWISVLLWGFVAIRLICPFTIDSVLSLIPSSETIPVGVVTGTAPQVHTGIDVLNSTINPVISETFQTGPVSGTYSPEFWLHLASMVWLMGFAAMLIYTVVTYMLLRRKVDTAIWQRENIYCSEYVASPFVLGIFRPRIYLPFGIDGNDLDHVIAHEKAHISRKDHWWKPMGFLLLALHWFNPLMWLGYILLCRDIELACDEKVIKDMDSEHKADYTQALVTCSIQRRSIAACPLAFGEVGVKERVKSVMNYKKPGFWLVLASTVACIVVAVCFLTDPKEPSAPVVTDISKQIYAVAEVVSEDGLSSYRVMPGENSPLYTITKDMQLSSQGEWSAKDEWTPLGKLEEVQLTRENFDNLFRFAFWAQGMDAETVRKDTLHAWKVIYNQEILYYVLQQKNGDLYLAYGYTQPGYEETSLRWLFKLEVQSNYLGPVETIRGNLKTYYKNADGTYQFNGQIYKYCMNISGQNPDSSETSTFVYLSNLKHISFARAWYAAEFSSNKEDYFDPEDAVLVEWTTEPVT